VDSRRIAVGAELSTAACVACDERKAAVDNSGRTEIFILRGQLHRRQCGQVLLVRREPLQTRMRTMQVVPAQVVGDVGSRRAHAIVGLQVHPFVLDAAPQALHKHVGASSQLRRMVTLSADLFG